MNQQEQDQKKKMNIATAFRKWLLMLVDFGIFGNYGVFVGITDGT